MNKNKILIVEDEIFIALDIKATVEDLGYCVTKLATDYDDALKSIIENEPDIILMDINLGKSKNGIEISKSIKKIKDIPIIFLTAFADDKTLYEAMMTEPSGYVTKPFKRSQIKSALALAKVKHLSKYKDVSFNQMLKNEIAFYELNPDDEKFKNDEVYLLKRYIKAIKDNGSFLDKAVIQIIKSEHIDID